MLKEGVYMLFHLKYTHSAESYLKIIKKQVRFLKIVFVKQMSME